MEDFAAMPRRRQIAYIASELSAQKNPVHPLDKVVQGLEKRSRNRAQKGGK